MSFLRLIQFPQDKSLKLKIKAFFRLLIMYLHTQKIKKHIIVKSKIMSNREKNF